MLPLSPNTFTQVSTMRSNSSAVNCIGILCGPRRLHPSGHGSALSKCLRSSQYDAFNSFAVNCIGILCGPQRLHPSCHASALSKCPPPSRYDAFHSLGVNLLCISLRPSAFTSVVPCFCSLQMPSLKSVRCVQFLCGKLHWYSL